MRNTRSLARRATLTATAVTAALVLAACGSDGDDSGSGSGSAAKPSAPAGADATAGAHNDQDVTFAQGMIPHHRQAVEMAGMAATQASSTEVKDLAARIEKAQDPEIRTMSGWLKAWNEDVPSAMPSMNHSGHSDGSGMEGMEGMAGMMDQKDMDTLAKASGKDFDAMFLRMMVEHHEGAVKMATTEKQKGRYQPATTMADAIITAQNAEIQQMKKLLGSS